MKKLLYILSAMALLSACNDKWDDYYKTNPIDQSIVAEAVVDGNLKDFFEAQTEYSSFYGWLKNAGVDEELARDQYMTIWAVKNDVFDSQPEFSADDSSAILYHANYLAFGINDLKDGLRIKALNNIYFQIDVIDGKYMVNKKAQILDSYKTDNGVVFILDQRLEPKVNIYNYLYDLGDDYSIIRDSIFKYNEMVFDEANSTPVSVDKTGNTVYDSVFYVNNPLFENAKFNSEFSQFTTFVPSNEVIDNCFKKLASQYALMGQAFTAADTILAMTWIKEAMFYDGNITDFEQEDINSACGRTWRTTVQGLDLNNPLELSNGTVYQITDLKIPNNVIISRIKSLVHYYEYLTDEEKAEYYTLRGNTVAPSIETLDATPKTDILPNYIVLQTLGDTESSDEFSIEFKPLERYLDDSGTYRARVMQVPPGEYYFYMGFHSQVHPFVDIYFNGELKGECLEISKSTPWNYDRVNETESSKWNGLGGLVGTVNIEGDEMQSFTVKVQFNKLNSASDPKRLRPYHWALKPTSNNY